MGTEGTPRLTAPTDSSQKPLMQLSVDSQQSALEVHLSPCAEHVAFGGLLPQTSPPSAAPCSQ